MQGEAGRDEQEEEEAEKRRTFDRLTEAASELLDLGHEDIYQETRETLVVSLSGGMQKSSSYIWHDDGQSVPRQHDPLDHITTFRDLPSTAGRSDGVPYRRAGLGTKQEAGQDGATAEPQPVPQPVPAPEREPIEERNKRLAGSTAAKAAAGAWDFRSGVHYKYDGPGASKPASLKAPEPQLTRTERPPPVPKLAPLPPAPVRPMAPTSGGYPLPPAHAASTSYSAYPPHPATAYPYAPPHAGHWQQPPPYAGYPQPPSVAAAPPAAVPYPGAEYQQWQQYSGAPPPAYPYT
ncbi:hypothetical protein COCSUDRAFT_67540 [Coccomyxa subellipsoidea C-169]|uniref:Uncharacterized protein n=1 Tax=Coccomyxa subellipsoidea (strain C-169) TaxID=574566 RepID=I0YPA0_COCSC|nr:hypothetical protein COCSUDRAFT_67540 [Coccomyxa subellipsoidea C-169]EIE20219.1 hypothetical protein COCSUDRAFT_67540 [Coccomyxa subellipsoidea C-169]|eukprot:XP_005644763.1 hypothetical protein COCSUDRAFT_67540 [Coccomyxa subellipsoidea C-169]